MIQDILEIANTLIVQVMPEIVQFVETAPLGDEIGYIFMIIRVLTLIQRVVVTGRRFTSRFEAKRRSQQVRGED